MPTGLPPSSAPKAMPKPASSRPQPRRKPCSRDPCKRIAQLRVHGGRTGAREARCAAEDGPRGRERDEINKGGLKVFPADIDEVVERYPAARDVCSFGFAAKEHCAVAEKLLAEPPKERFDRIVVDKKVATREGHLKDLRGLVKKIRALDAQVDELLANLAREDEKTWQEFAERTPAQRDARRDVPLGGGGAPFATSTSLALQLMGSLTSPSQAAMRAELHGRLEEAIERMDALDREVLALRHFEELTNAETAEVLGIQQKAASMRYMRALGRLKEILAELPGFASGASAGT